MNMFGALFASLGATFTLARLLQGRVRLIGRSVRAELGACCDRLVEAGSEMM